jgi:NitT/TauT family transport system permease protein
MIEIFKKLNKLLPILLLLVIWYIGSNYLNPLFLPSPKKVFESFGELLKNGMLINSLLISFIRILVAMILSISISIPLALLIFGFKWVDTLITPITNILRYLPITAFYPLLILYLGINEKMKIMFLFIATFVYFLPSMILCIKDVDKGIIEAGYALGMNKWQVITNIILPYSLPLICENILIMSGMGWTYITVAEMINANKGLGFLINVSSSRGRTDIVFVSILTIVLISWFIDNIANWLIHKTFTWKYNI